MMYDLAVITVSHNDLNAACLSSIERCRKASTSSVQVVIVDNASTAYQANEIVREHIPDAICLLRNGDFGFGRSCNRGAEEASARYLLFLNPDTVLHDEAVFDQLVTFLDTHPKAGIAAPKVLYNDGRLQETCRRFPKWFIPLIQRTSLAQKSWGEKHHREFVMRDYDHKDIRMVDWVQGSALCISAALFTQLGGFDHRFWMYYEDVDLCRRAWVAGRPVYYLPSTEVQHAHTKASARKGSQILNLLQNKMARAHTKSWLQYTWKWKGRRAP